MCVCACTCVGCKECVWGEGVRERVCVWRRVWVLEECVGERVW